MTIIHDAWQSGFVRRWHSNPDMADCNDTNSSHQGRMVILCMQIFPDHSHDLLKACGSHDNAEDVAGDVSNPTKQANPELADAIQAIEDETLKKRGLYVELTAEDQNRLKFLDRLDAYKMMIRHNSDLSMRDDWVKAGEWLVVTADKLGVYSMLVNEF